MDSAMGGYARDAKTCTLIHTHVFGKRHGLLDGDHRELRSRTERAIRLRSVAPYGPSEPIPRNPIADSIHMTSAITMWYDSRIRHTIGKRVLALLNVAWIDSGGRDVNS
jgi:hypothetical protein